MAIQHDNRTVYLFSGVDEARFALLAIAAVLQLQPLLRPGA